VLRSDDEAIFSTAQCWVIGIGGSAIRLHSRRWGCRSRRISDIALEGRRARYFGAYDVHLLLIGFHPIAMNVIHTSNHLARMDA